MKASIKSLVALATLVVGVTAAHAEDPKTYSAAACDSNSTDLKWTFSKAYNDSDTSKIGIYCPIINDYSTQPMYGAQVEVFDDHNTQDICCTLRSGRSVGGSSMSWYTEKQCTSNKGQQTLSFGTLTGAGFEYTYHLVCNIPPRDNGDESYVLYYHAY